MKDYSRLEMLSLRSKMRSYSTAFRAIVKAHSVKHANYVVLPKTLLYGLLDDLDALSAIGTSDDMAPYSVYNTAVRTATYVLPEIGGESSEKTTQRKGVDEC